MARPDPTDEGNIWVLYRTEGEGGSGVIICGTAYTRAEAEHWGRNSRLKGAIRVPLGGLANGETYGPS